MRLIGPLKKMPLRRKNAAFHPWTFGRDREPLRIDTRALELAKPRGPLAFGYIRVSTHEQRLGFSLDSQEARCRQFAEGLAAQGVGWGLLLCDDGVSALKHTLFARRQGRFLAIALREGDHLIIPMFDRAFRHIRDMSNSYYGYLKPKGIILHRPAAGSR